MQINGQNSYSPNFTSITNARVLINGRPSLHRENVKTAVRQLQQILTNPANGDERLKAIKSVFVQNVKDFQYAAGAGLRKDELIRNVPDADLKKLSKELADDNLVYIFTGKESEELAKRGKKIGPERSLSDKFYKQQGIDLKSYRKEYNNRPKSAEELEKTFDYYNKISSLLTRENRYTKRNGNLLELFIETTRDAKGKISIKEIFFKEKTPPKPPTQESTQPAQSTLSKVVKKVKKGAKKVKNTFIDTQLSLF